MAIRGVKQQPRPSRPGVEGVRDAGDVGGGQLAVGANGGEGEARRQPRPVLWYRYAAVQRLGDRTVHSASDLVGFLECRHLAALERAAVLGHTKRPMRPDRFLDRIVKRGFQHERRFLDGLAAQGREVAEMALDRSLPPPERYAAGCEATLAAMRAGRDVIFQAALFDGERLGFADFLLRVDRPSELGAWSYEVWDTKLARSVKASAMLQLCRYSDMVAGMQGVAPERMHLALGGAKGQTVAFRVADYAAYYRSVASRFEAFLHDDAPAWPLPTEPEPVGHCGVCRWRPECSAVWRRDDHLSLVADIGARQRDALRAHGVHTRTALGERLPEDAKPLTAEAVERLHLQAAIQLRGEREGVTLSERIAPARDADGALLPNQGLLLLPEPSRGDLFFDIEGDPFYMGLGADGAGVDGIEYLFGVIEPARADDDGEPAFHALWSLDGEAVTPAAERRAFERLIDLIMDRWDADPALHVYHYAPYEPGAMTRLAGRYGTREEEVDQLLRGNVFVDLHRVVRGGIRASVEGYSLKAIEPLFRFEREIELRDANASIVAFEEWLELGEGEGERGAETLADIERYNRDDCVSTWRLRDWLEGQRDELAAELDEPLPRPQVVEPEESKDSEAQREVRELAEALVEGLPDEAERNDAERARQLLAHLLQWHRREDKAFWWRYFALKGLTDEERIGQRDALGGLALEDSWPDPDKPRSTVHRFRFPLQEHKFREGDNPHDPAGDPDGFGKPAGEVVAVDDTAGTIDLRRGKAWEDGRPPTALIPHDLVYARPKPESQQRVARWVLDHGVDARGPHRAIRDLLMRRPPRAGQPPGEPLRREGEDAQAAARRIALALDESYLAIQGPPGSGKSTVGAQLIVDLVADGRRVGVTANSHKVIAQILDKTAQAARARDVPVAIGQRARNETDVAEDAEFLEKNEFARDGLAIGAYDVVGGTAWLWARDDMAGMVDTLVVDESGQTSLADVLAAAPCARNLILLGDPQQLDQPLQGAHPPGAERSALAHLLGEEQVMPESLGLFLDGTWRLHPRICAYTSEVFYAGRLHAHEGRERHAVTGGEPPFDGAGIRFLPAAHEGRSSESPEEVALIRERVRALLGSDAAWTDANGLDQPLTRDDVLIISPYNAQVRALEKALPGFRIGTVDKFQGQEAPVAIYSMATSSVADAPRGMEFLYSLNRLNVATSRARCLAVVVASPELTQALCRTPRQMRLANALARLVEVAG